METQVGNIEAYRRIASFVNEFGLENLTVKKLKTVDPKLLSFISSKLGGLKSVRLEISTGQLNLNEHLEVTDVSKEADKVIAKMKEDGGVYVDQELVNCMTSPKEIPQNEMLLHDDEPVFTTKDEENFASIGNYLKVMAQITQHLERISSKQDSMEEFLVSTAKSIPTSIDKMNEKLKILETDMVNNVREKISELVLKYCYIKFGNTNPDSVRKAYNDMYFTFNRVYGVNLDSIQVTTINITNHNRAREGKRAIDYIDPKTKGLRKIDIVERLGMLPELYMIVKSKLSEKI